MKDDPPPCQRLEDHVPPTAFKSMSRLGKNRIHLAVQYNVSSEILRKTLKEGADVNATSKCLRTPLHSTQSQGTLRILLEAGALLSSSDRDGQTPLHYIALRNENPDLLKAAVVAGAEINARDKKGRTPLDLAITRKMHRNAEVLQALGAETGSVPSAVSRSDDEEPTSRRSRRKASCRLRSRLDEAAINSPLHEAITNGEDAEALIRLIEQGNDPNATDRLGKTPLHLAAQERREISIIEVLLDAGGDPNAINKSGTALHYARDEQTIRELLSAGADVNLRNSDGRTALHNSAYHAANPSTLHAFFVAGSDVNAVDRRGKTPLDIAVRSGRNSTVDMLIACGGRLSSDLISGGDPSNAIDPTAKDEEGDTSLHRVARIAKTGTAIEYLVDSGADPNALNQAEETPLCAAAAANENTEVLAALIRAGSIVFDYDRPTACEFACKSSQNLEVLRLLIATEPHSANEPGGGWRYPLHWAVLRADKAADFVRVLLDNGADPNCTDFVDGDTPLHLAAANPSVEVLRILIDASKSIDPAGAAGETPLSRAAGNKDTRNLDLLLDAGASVETRNHHGLSPAHVAAMNPNPELLAHLSAAGADLLASTSDGRSVLHFAVAGSPDASRLVLDQTGENLARRRSKLDVTPLHYAATADDPSIVSHLLAAGAGSDINLATNSGNLIVEITKESRWAYELAMSGFDLRIAIAGGDTPLHLAARHGGKAEVFKTLLEAGASPFMTNDYGETPLMIAAGRCPPAIIKLLTNVDYYSTIHHRDELGKTPVHAAARNPDPEVLSIILKAGGRTLVNEAECSGQTPLHLAAQEADPALARLLLEAGAVARMNSRDSDGRSPLHLAAANENNAVASVLLEYEPILDQMGGDNDQTPLHIAIRNDNLETARHLLEAGANISPSLPGKGPIHSARSIEAVRLLINFGVDVNDRCPDTGFSCLHHHAGSGEAEAPGLLKLLIDEGADLNATYMGCTPLDFALGSTPLGFFLEEANPDNARVLRVEDGKKSEELA